MDESNFAFFSFNDDFDEVNKPNSKGKFTRKDKINYDYIEYVNAENDLESMIRDHVIEIHVDEGGTFFYYPSKLSLDAMVGLKVTPRHSTFAELLSRRGLNIDKYNRYKTLMRRLSP